MVTLLADVARARLVSDNAVTMRRCCNDVAMMLRRCCNDVATMLRRCRAFLCRVARA